eukprot:CAMPEP_0172471528 /NCGR_PEP_ID=MMETSP1065-20121228/67865_1 /TAXON_ID=265537 /ORGANISM="Amphiprora paludosa, Strain CCMP125" /LENGTH=795 /DNA_ID=CAMNT_0013229631 /DNA_START=79 /DNA_END=2463 /DNA_ORIENTATION=-
MEPPPPRLPQEDNAIMAEPAREPETPNTPHRIQLNHPMQAPGSTDVVCSVLDRGMLLNGTEEYPPNMKAWHLCHLVFGYGSWMMGLLRAMRGIIGEADALWIAFTKEGHGMLLVKHGVEMPDIRSVLCQNVRIVADDSKDKKCPDPLSTERAKELGSLDPHQTVVEKLDQLHDPKNARFFVVCEGLTTWEHGWNRRKQAIFRVDLEERKFYNDDEGEEELAKAEMDKGTMQSLTEITNVTSWMEATGRTTKANSADYVDYIRYRKKLEATAARGEQDEIVLLGENDRRKRAVGQYRPLEDEPMEIDARPVPGELNLQQDPAAAEADSQPAAPANQAAAANPAAAEEPSQPAAPANQAAAEEPSQPVRPANQAAAANPAAAEEPSQPAAPANQAAAEEPSQPANQAVAANPPPAKAVARKPAPKPPAKAAATARKSAPKPPAKAAATAGKSAPKPKPPAKAAVTARKSAPKPPAKPDSKSSAKAAARKPPPKPPAKPAPTAARKTRKAIAEAQKDQNPAEIWEGHYGNLKRFFKKYRHSAVALIPDEESDREGLDWTEFHEWVVHQREKLTDMIEKGTLNGEDLTRVDRLVELSVFEPEVQARYKALNDSAFSPREVDTPQVTTPASKRAATKTAAQRKILSPKRKSQSSQDTASSAKKHKRNEDTSEDPFINNKAQPSMKNLFVKEWYQKLGWLKELKKVTGKATATSAETKAFGRPTLYEWIRYQRVRKPKHPKWKIDELDKIGFVWVVHKEDELKRRKDPTGKKMLEKLEKAAKKRAQREEVDEEEDVDEEEE